MVGAQKCIVFGPAGEFKNLENSDWVATEDIICTITKERAEKSVRNNSL